MENSPVFIQALALEGGDVPETMLDLNRWMKEKVWVLGRKGVGLIYEDGVGDGSASEKVSEIPQRIQTIFIASTKQGISAAIERFPGYEAFQKLSIDLLVQYSPDDLLEALIPDITLLDNNAPRYIPAFAVYEKMKRITGILSQAKITNTDIVSITTEALTPHTLTDVQVRHINEVLTNCDWVLGVRAVLIHVNGTEMNAILYTVADANDVTFEDIQAFTNAMSSDLHLSLAYAFDTESNQQKIIPLSRTQQQPNGLRDPDLSQLDAAGFGPHGLTDDQVDTLNEILAQHDWIISARVVAKKIDGVERNAVIIGTDMIPSSQSSKEQGAQLLDELKARLEGVYFRGVGEDAIIGNSKTVPYSSRWLGRD